MFIVCDDACFIKFQFLDGKLGFLMIYPKSGAIEITELVLKILGIDRPSMLKLESGPKNKDYSR